VLSLKEKGNSLSIHPRLTLVRKEERKSDHH
jgi:hypothetical protein